MYTYIKGDFVDRGRYSVATLILFFCLKAKYPDRITLLRGNHETRQTTTTYGFYDDCMKLYGNRGPWAKCMELFDCLPLVAVWSKHYHITLLLYPLLFFVRFLTSSIIISCSPANRWRDSVCSRRTLSRHLHHWPDSSHSSTYGSSLEYVLYGSHVEWSRSTSFKMGNIQQRRRSSIWLSGHTWGIHLSLPSFTHFSPFFSIISLLWQFCALNQLSLVARAHQLVLEGYKFAFPQEDILVTVWSAPNYCYASGNIASVMQVYENGHKHFVRFSEVADAERVIPPTLPIPYFLWLGMFSSHPTSLHIFWKWLMIVLSGDWPGEEDPLGICVIGTVIPSS